MVFYRKKNKKKLKFVIVVGVQVVLEIQVVLEVKIALEVMVVFGSEDRYNMNR